MRDFFVRAAAIPAAAAPLIPPKLCAPPAGLLTARAARARVLAAYWRGDPGWSGQPPAAAAAGGGAGF